jgi:hypothetical protein
MNISKMVSIQVNVIVNGMLVINVMCNVTSSIQLCSHVIMCVAYDYNIRHECNRRSIFCHFSKL